MRRLNDVAIWHQNLNAIGCGLDISDGCDVAKTDVMTILVPESGVAGCALIVCVKLLLLMCGGFDEGAGVDVDCNDNNLSESLFKLQIGFTLRLSGIKGTPPSPPHQAALVPRHLPLAPPSFCVAVASSR
jgi:hypothetical protein